MVKTSPTPKTYPDNISIAIIKYLFSKDKGAALGQH
jgi:hypothetical protein